MARLTTFIDHLTQMTLFAGTDRAGAPIPRDSDARVPDRRQQHLRVRLVFAGDAQNLFVGDRAGRIDLGTVDGHRDPSPPGPPAAAGGSAHHNPQIPLDTRQQSIGITTQSFHEALIGISRVAADNITGPEEPFNDGR